jgi:hypothetical protein
MLTLAASCLHFNSDQLGGARVSDNPITAATLGLQQRPSSPAPTIAASASADRHGLIIVAFMTHFRESPQTPLPAAVNKCNKGGTFQLMRPFQAMRPINRLTLTTTLVCTRRFHAQKLAAVPSTRAAQAIVVYNQ